MVHCSIHKRKEVIVMNEAIQQGNRNETPEEIKARLEAERKAEEEEAKRKKNSPFRNFIQVNDDNYAAEDWLMKTSPAGYRILRFIVTNMDNYNALICSYRVMQEKLGYSRPTISSALKILREHKYINVAKSGSSNVYFVNRELYWKSWGSNYKYAEFGAKIILSAEEQDSIEQKLIVEKRRIATLQENPESVTA